MFAFPYSSPFYKFLAYTELADAVTQFSTWSTIVVISNVNRRLRSIVQALIQTRVRAFLTEFVPHRDHEIFFELLEATDAIIAGSVVRCIMSVEMYDHYRAAHPTQLTIVVPISPNCTASDSGTVAFRQWCKFIEGSGYEDAMGGGVSPAPLHLDATTLEWFLFKNDKGMHISLIQSRTCSPLSPILQSCHTSNFFAMSTTRMYCMYPDLFAAKVNLNMKARMPVLPCAFDSFNYGLLSFTRTNSWRVFAEGGCGEACPSVWRRVFGLPGTGIFRWGSFKGDKDTGIAVSAVDAFVERDEIWKVHGECSNSTCRTFRHCTDLFAAMLAARGP